MTIVADENIPFAEQAFKAFGEIRLLPGRSITRDDLHDADALVVRSVTRVNETLLAGTPVRFVGTATIGTDHIDLDYLHRASISFADAAGSNARSVAEYVVAALLELHQRNLLSLEQASLGVVGVGHVGSIVVQMAEALGMEVVQYDPPRAERDEDFTSADLDAVLSCTAITLHVPLIDSGAYPTRHLVDKELLRRMSPRTILINTSRGAVVESSALVSALRSEQLCGAVLDVWEEEPDIPVGLIEQCAIATPHIAGYSFDGKVRGTEMMAQALATAAGKQATWNGVDVLPSQAGDISLPSHGSPLGALHRAVSEAYDIMQDDAAVRRLLTGDSAARRAGFDGLRRDYRRRREFPAYRVITDDPIVQARASALGFTADPQNARS